MIIRNTSEVCLLRLIKRIGDCKAAPKAFNTAPKLPCVGSRAGGSASVRGPNGRISIFPSSGVLYLA